MYTEWKNRQPGKFEGSHSVHVATVLLDLANNGWFNEQEGDVQVGNFYTLILGKKYDFILTEDEQGFVTYEIFNKDEQEVTDYWNDIVEEMYD